ncbi:MAG: hypothetical protein JW969_14790 [Spirochaetales bacterium]|nr:hypothetical protein [Spirochaetales bacterium]
MCTSFISRKDNTIVGMNFDNNEMKFSIDTQKHDGWFVVYVDTGRGRFPSFGIDKDGRFFNSLVVNSNGKGLYRRPGSRVTHTTKLVADILNGVIETEQLTEYLERVEVVNTPNSSCHNMICDSNANVWIVEPGRGNIFSPVEESPFYVMSNVSLIDMKADNNGCECERYKKATGMLSKIDEMNIEKAFTVLESVSQKTGDWITDFSFVFSKKQKKVHYCFHNDFGKMDEYLF